VALYVANHGWHTGLVFRRADIPPSIDWPELALFPEGDWLEIGWGDAGFYMADRITSGLAVRAIFWPTPSVLHVVAFDGHPAWYFEGSEIVRVDVSTEGFDALLRGLIESFDRKNPAEMADDLGPGLYGRSRFYRARGNYWLFNTCNHWTAEAIRDAGCPITPFYSITAGNVMWQTGRFGERVAQEDR